MNWGLSKRLFPLFLIICLASCGNPGVAPADNSNTPAAQTEVVVFAAASLTESLEEIATLYAKTAPEVKLVFNFDSSGTLKTQIQEGAECDLFLSAAQTQIHQLDATVPVEENPQQLNFILADSRINLLENRVVLVTSKENPAKIDSFDALAKALQAGETLLAMGNSDVPVGQYSQKILAYYRLDEQALAGAGSISYGSNVKEVTTQVTEGSVDCGIIYATDARSAGLTPVDFATTEMCGQIIYPAALISTGKHAVAAQAFLDYLRGDQAAAVFEQVGFAPLKGR